MLWLNHLCLHCFIFQSMFCADYIASFIHHGFISIGAIHFYQDDAKNALPGSPILFGSLAGFLGACSVYPFDFVRQGAVPGVKVQGYIC